MATHGICPCCLGSFKLLGRGHMPRHGFHARGVRHGQPGSGTHIGRCRGSGLGRIGTKGGNSFALWYASQLEARAQELHDMGPVTKAEALRATIDIARDNVMQRIFGNLTERVAARERYSTPEAFADTAHRRMFTDARVEGRRSDMTRERVGSIADMRAHAELVRQRVAENPVEEGAAGA